MRFRILIAMVCVTAVAVVLFAAPLAIAFRDLHREEEVVRLERAAAEAAGEIPASFPKKINAGEFNPRHGTRSIGVYGRDLRLVAGVGPARGDEPVRAGLRGDLRDREIHGHLVVGSPLTRGEHVVGVIRASVPIAVVTDRTRNVLLIMAAIAVGVLLVAGLIALWQSRRLARPVDRLAGYATRLGDGDFTVRTERSGVPEVDAVAGALDATAVRLDEMLSRERRFSEDASHQLRTPLTSLRVTLEAARLDPGADRDRMIDTAIDEVDRLDRTIDDLLTLAREDPSTRARADVAAVLAALEDDWHGRLATVARPLAVSVDAKVATVRISERALRQILDVLVENAVRHGSGAIAVRARAASAGLVIDVSDEGAGVAADKERIFERRVSTAGRTGIGLALARSLAEAEGGRLLLAATGPRPTFSIVLPAVEP